MEARPPALMVDNQPATALAKDQVLHDRSKHIDVKFHFLRDCVDGGHIVIKFTAYLYRAAEGPTSYVLDIHLNSDMSR